MFLYLLSQSIYAAIAKYHRLGSLLKNIYFSWVWRLGNPRSGCQQIRCLVRALSLGCRRQVLCPQAVKGKELAFPNWLLCLDTALMTLPFQGSPTAAPGMKLNVSRVMSLAQGSNGDVKLQIWGNVPKIEETEKKKRGKRKNSIPQRAPLPRVLAHLMLLRNKAGAPRFPIPKDRDGITLRKRKELPFPVLDPFLSLLNIPQPTSQPAKLLGCQIYFVICSLARVI